MGFDYDPPALPHTAYIGLGSNLGDRQAMLRSALKNLSETTSLQVTKVSRFLENPAVGGPVDAPPFLNGAAELETSLEPAQLLLELLAIEKNLGRYRREKWGPRSIDLDLLLYDDLHLEKKGLIVPHPLMHQRRFVLQPLAEIAPKKVHPTLNRTVEQLLSELPNQPPINNS